MANEERNIYDLLKESSQKRHEADTRRMPVAQTDKRTLEEVVEDLAARVLAGEVTDLRQACIDAWDTIDAEGQRLCAIDGLALRLYAELDPQEGEAA